MVKAKVYHCLEFYDDPQLVLLQSDFNYYLAIRILHDNPEINWLAVLMTPADLDPYLKGELDTRSVFTGATNAYLSGFYGVEGEMALLIDCNGIREEWLPLSDHLIELT